MLPTIFVCTSQTGLHTEAYMYFEVLVTQELYTHS